MRRATRFFLRCRIARLRGLTCGDCTCMNATGLLCAQGEACAQRILQSCNSSELMKSFSGLSSGLRSFGRKLLRGLRTTSFVSTLHSRTPGA